MADKKYTIKEEIKKLGIDPLFFNVFYENLKIGGELPPSTLFPEKQYESIFAYLKQNKVLGKNGKIQEEDLKIFDSRKTLEEIMLTKRKRRREEPPYFGSGGGLITCRDEDREITSNGGVISCRD